MKQPLYIGLMSGTSVDAVDAVLISLEDGSIGIVGHFSSPIPANLRRDINKLSYPGEDSIDLFGQTDIAIGMLFAETALMLIQQQKLLPADITAIGSHGQTIRHRPDKGDPSHHFSVQIGDPNTIAATTGITTVADFRRKDMALGGEGAPLVPAFHADMFRHKTLNRAIVNIGGIANITWLPATSTGCPVTGFDSGPGNCLMDAWITAHRNQPFDHSGTWAAAGSCQKKLLDQLLSNPFLHRLPPKSTGKETFNLSWLENIVTTQEEKIKAQDIQATLCRYTAKCIALGLKQLPEPADLDEIYLCGGGALNNFLVECICEEQTNVRVQAISALGMDPFHVEAAAFAWLAQRTIHRLNGNLTTVTGAQRESILGGIYFA